MIKQTAITLMLTVAALSLSGVAVAQQAGDAPMGNAGATAAPEQQEVQQLVQELQEKAQRLQEIHDETLAANPELAQEQEEYMELVKNEIKEQGYDLDAGQERVKTMSEKLQDQDLSDEERQNIMQEYQNEQQQLGQARAAALQQEDIQEAGQQLQDDTLTAMKAHSDEVEQLMQDMQEIRQQLQSIQQQQAPAPN
ncbi:MAG TPA: hypothetical protein VK110_03055 [Salinisphaeraceae bacterium]|nr:hypothetical protein [Salinisphaeraceae bacterium]